AHCLRPRGGHGLRLRPGHRAGGHPALRHRGHPPLLRERPPLPGAVPLVKIPLAWLAEFVEVKAEPARLAEALTLVGLAVEGIEGKGADTVLDLDVTTNRPDCMNVYGVAREVSVIYGLPLRPLDLAFTETGPFASEALTVEIEAQDLCPRF